MKVFNWKLNVLKNKLFRHLNIQFKNKDIIFLLFFNVQGLYAVLYLYCGKASVATLCY